MRELQEARELIERAVADPTTPWWVAQVLEGVLEGTEDPTQAWAAAALLEQLLDPYVRELTRTVREA